MTPTDPARVLTWGDVDVTWEDMKKSHPASQLLYAVNNSPSVTYTPAEYVGKFPVKQEVKILPADDPKKLKLGWCIYEEIGVVIINEAAIAKVKISGIDEDEEEVEFKWPPQKGTYHGDKSRWDL